LRCLPFDRHELLRKHSRSKSSDVVAIGGIAAAVGAAAVVATQLVRKSSRRNSPHSGNAV
jgi:hypothetical protein